MPKPTLVVIVGQEGSAKSTTVRALGAVIPLSASLDAEDVGTVNPWQMDDAFLDLLWRNVADVTRNFWAAGYHTVVAGSFASNLDQSIRFRAILDAEAEVRVVHLCAGKTERDMRRIERAKPSTAEWRDHVDRIDPEDATFARPDGGYRYLRIDNDELAVDQCVDRIRAWAPELFVAAAIDRS